MGYDFVAKCTCSDAILETCKSKHSQGCCWHGDGWNCCGRKGLSYTASTDLIIQELAERFERSSNLYEITLGFVGLATLIMFVALIFCALDATHYRWKKLTLMEQNAKLFQPNKPLESDLESTVQSTTTLLNAASTLSRQPIQLPQADADGLIQCTSAAINKAPSRFVSFQQGPLFLNFPKEDERIKNCSSVPLLEEITEESYL